MRTPRFVLPALLLPLLAASAPADVGDPQVQTDDPWYPGELACSTFERLFATQAAAYRRATGRPVTTDEDKALASWLWRNTHYWHGEEGGEDLWGRGFGPGKDTRSRDYWTGLFANGFALCGTTHSQWVAEMEALLGHGRGRTVGAAGHNTFEVFLTGGPYGAGRWVLLDHDLSTVVFAPDGSRLLGMAEVVKDWRRLTDRTFRPGRQRGWLICGLHPDDAASYRQYTTAEYLSGYAGPPPTVHLRRGESLRRYLRPGLDDGKTFVFWGRNSNAAGVPGPERPQTWVNQPGKMFGAKASTPYRAGQARYANAVYTYRPDFRSGDYREGVSSEDDQQVTFAFTTPYIVAATPPNAKPWGIFDAGCKNGLVLNGTADCNVSVSVDRGATWADCGRLAGGLDLTDRVKGHRQYLLRLGAPAAKLADSKLTIRTVCQANAAVMPHLTDGGSKVRFEASGRATVSAGPNVPQAARHVVAGKIDGPAVTLELKTPRGEPVRAVYAAARVSSGSPPRPDVRYQIDYSTDGGKTWRPVVKDWTVNRCGDEPRDFWSQSFCWGSAEVKGRNVSTVRVRFRNDGGKRYLRPEVHLVYDTRPDDPTRVTFAWTDDRGQRRHSHTAAAGQPTEWTVPTGKKTETRWVEFEPAPAGK
jgi:hypothetical protein